MGGPGVIVSMNDLERGLSQNRNHDQNQHATQDVPPSNYRDQKVKPNLDYQPWLTILDEFLNPDEKNFKVSFDHRIWHFDVDIIHISASGEVGPLINCIDKAEFLKQVSNADNEPRSTLIIAEDISVAMIEALGIKYDLEPEFFACHLLGTEAFRTGGWQSPTVRFPARAPNALYDYVRKAPHYVVEFRRPYRIEGGHKKIEDLRSKETNTPRGAQILHKERGIPDTFIFEKISVYKRKGSKFGRLDCSTVEKSFYPQKKANIP
jgi:hypothetical protein